MPSASRRRHERGRFASIVVVAEGAEPVPGTLEVAEKVYDKFGHVRLGGISDVIARGDRRAHRVRDPGRHARPRPAGRHPDGVRPRAVARASASPPSTSSTTLAWGQMVVARGADIVAAPLAPTVGQTRPVDLRLSTTSPRSSSPDDAGFVRRVWRRGFAHAERLRTSGSSGGVGAALGGIGGVGRLGRLGEAGVVVDGERLGPGSSPRPSGHAAVLAVDAQAHRAHAVELAGREHDLGDGEDQRRARQRRGSAGDRSTCSVPATGRRRAAAEVGRQRRAQPVARSRCSLGP